MTNYTVSTLPLAEILEIDGLTPEVIEPDDTLVRNDGGPNDVGSVNHSGLIDNSGSIAVERDGSFNVAAETSYGPSLNEDELGQLQANLFVSVSQGFAASTAAFSVPVVLIPITSQAPLDQPIQVSAGFEFSTTVNTATNADGPSIAYSLDFATPVRRTFLENPTADRILSFPSQELAPLSTTTLRLAVEAFPGTSTANFVAFPEGGRVIDGVLKFGTQDPFGISFDFDFKLPTLQISDDQMIEVDGKMVPASEVFIIAGPDNAGILGVFPEQIPDTLDGFLFEPHNILDVRDMTISSRGTDEDGFEAGFEQPGLGLEAERGQVDGLTLDVPNGVLITQTTLRPEALTVFESNQPVIAVAGNDVTIRNAGTVEGLVQNGVGILLGSSALNSGNVIENSGLVKTGGREAPGILAAGNGTKVDQTGTVETNGDSAYGIWAVGKNLDVTNDGDITTEGENSFGVMLGTARAGSAIEVFASDIFELQRGIANELDPDEAAAFLDRSTGSFLNTGVIETKATAVLPTEGGGGTLAPALFVNFDNSTVTNQGTVRAQSAAVVLNGTNLTFSNEGDVELTASDEGDSLLGGVAVFVDGFERTTVTNSGTISGDVVFAGTDGQFTNDGEVEDQLQVGAVPFSGVGPGTFLLTTGVGSTLGTDTSETHTLNLLGEAGALADASFSMVSAGAIKGALNVLAGSQTITLEGNSATIEAVGETALNTTGNVTAVLEGGIVATNADAFAVTEIEASSLDLTVRTDGGLAATNGSGLTAVVSGKINVNTAGLVSVSGMDVQGLDVASLNDQNDVTNTGTIEAVGVNASAIRTSGGDVVNTGVISATGAGAFGVETGSGTITNAAGGVISVSGSGAAGVFGNAGLTFSERAPLTLFNAGLITGTGGADAVLGSAVDDRVTNSGVFAGDVDLGLGDDTLTWLAGGTTTSAVTGNLGNDLLIARGGALDGSLFLDFEELQVEGDVSLTGFLSVRSADIISGTLELDGVIDGDAKVASGATLIGSGVITGNLEAEEGAILGPGFSPGTITVEGDAKIAGTLVLEIGGPDSQDVDGLIVLGTLDLSDATVEVRIIDGYEPAPGAPVRLFEAAGITGLDNAQISVEGLPPGIDFDISPDGSSQFVPAPTGNGAPVAVDDPNVTVQEDLPSYLDFLSNDSDPDGDPLTVEIRSAPMHGELTRDSIGWLYAPDPDFTGIDTFTYAISDGEFSDTATVSITVEPVNDAPVGVADRYNATFETPLTVSAFAGVLSNDNDVDGDSLTAVLETRPSNGSLLLSSDGSFLYTPDVGFSGSDSFTYFANDGFANAASATSVTIDVAPKSFAENDLYEVSEDTLDTFGSSLFRIGAKRDDTFLLANDLGGETITSINGSSLENGIFFDGDAGGQFRVYAGGVVDFRNQGKEVQPGDITGFSYTVIDREGNADVARVAVSFISSLENNGISSGFAFELHTKSHDTDTAADSYAADDFIFVDGGTNGLGELSEDPRLKLANSGGASSEYVESALPIGTISLSEGATNPETATLLFDHFEFA